ncbi:MAG: ECF transporter S component [Anaerolineae bacterium]|nr:ECF transporter S component [Anaerolineae bacterium]
MKETTVNHTLLLDIRKIVITGILAAIAILLGVTRWGFIPVPNLSGSATIMHVPAIIGGVMEGPLVGLLVGLIFGLFSWLQAQVPFFKDPIVAVLPRLFIGVTAYYSYALIKKHNEYLALVIAGVIGTLTNTVLVLSLLVLRGYMPVEALIPIIPQALAEVVIAVVITVAVVTGWKQIGRGSGKSSI